MLTMRIQRMVENRELCRLQTPEAQQQANSPIRARVGNFIASAVGRFRAQAGYFHEIHRTDELVRVLGHDVNEQAGAKIYARYAHAPEDVEIPFSD